MSSPKKSAISSTEEQDGANCSTRKTSKIPIGEIGIGFWIRRPFDDGKLYIARVMSEPRYVLDEEKDTMVECCKVKYAFDNQEEWADEDQLNEWAYNGDDDDDDNQKNGGEKQYHSTDNESYAVEKDTNKKLSDEDSASSPGFPGDPADTDTGAAMTPSPKRQKPIPRNYHMQQKTSELDASISSVDFTEGAYHNNENNPRESVSSPASSSITSSTETDENDRRRRSKRARRPTDNFISVASAEVASSSSSKKSSLTAGGGGRRKKANKLDVTKKTKEEAKKILMDKMGIAEEEVNFALDQMLAPYSQNEAINLIHNRRHEIRKLADGGCGEEAWVKFIPEIGMRVRVREGGSNYHGKVTEGPSYMTKEGELKPAKFWEVTFDDGTKEDYDWNQLLQCRASRPIIKFDDCRGRTLKALELFAGEGIVTQEFSELKWSVKSIDNRPDSYATDILDIMEAQYKDIGFVPDFIWASPPCTTCSNLAGGYHRSCKTGEFEKTQEARDHNRLMAQMMYIMKWAKKKNPHLIVVIENPQGQMQKLPMMIEFMRTFGLNKATVDYCAFERPDKKPTNLWTNDFNLHARLSNDFRCSEGKCPYHGKMHPIGIRSHKQFNAAAIPQKLAEEVAEYVQAKFLLDRIARSPIASLSPHEEEEFDLCMSDARHTMND